MTIYLDHDDSALYAGTASSGSYIRGSVRGPSTPPPTPSSRRPSSVGPGFEHRGLESPDGGEGALDAAVDGTAEITGRSAGRRPADRLALSVTEAAELVGISRALAYELVARGELPSVRLGRRVVVPRVALLQMFALPSAPPAP